MKVGANLSRTKVQHSMPAPGVERVDDAPLHYGGQARTLIE